MDLLAKVAGFAWATLLVPASNQWEGRWVRYVNSSSMDDVTDAYMTSDLPTRTQATPQLIAENRQGFVTNRDPFEGAFGILLVTPVAD
jgi:hypothetical protein